MSDERFAMAEQMTKQELLSRMRGYVESEAKRRKRPQWAIIGHIFSVGSGVASALWTDHIKIDAPQKDGE
jgi:hypothetical protein